MAEVAIGALATALKVVFSGIDRIMSNRELRHDYKTDMAESKKLVQKMHDHVLAQDKTRKPVSQELQVACNGLIRAWTKLTQLHDRRGNMLSQAFFASAPFEAAWREVIHQTAAIRTMFVVLCVGDEVQALHQKFDALTMKGPDTNGRRGATFSREDERVFLKLSHSDFVMASMTLDEIKHILHKVGVELPKPKPQSKQAFVAWLKSSELDVKQACIDNGLGCLF
jgi:hypothetical protein